MLTTLVMTKIAAQGPIRIVASAAPIRWPEVPPATAKLIICPAKIAAANTPIIGTCCSPRSFPTRRKAYPTIKIEMIHARKEIVIDKNPSGICKASADNSIHYSIFFASDPELTCIFTQANRAKAKKSSVNGMDLVASFIRKLFVEIF